MFLLKTYTHTHTQTWVTFLNHSFETDVSKRIHTRILTPQEKTHPLPSLIKDRWQNNIHTHTHVSFIILFYYYSL